jgi:acyl-CoA synthetase (AMP-forming)/AMP-acid ligase II
VHTLPELLRWRAQRHPDLVAMREPGRSVTWGELDAETTRLANGLRSLGVKPQDRVAILDKNSVAYLELMLAVAKLGAVSAPVNWRLAPREVQTVVNDAQAALCITGAEFAPAAAETNARIIDINDLPRDDGADPYGDTDPAAVAWQLYTSGTTGIPKGAMLTHRNLYAGWPSILLECPEMHEGSRALVAMPLYHIGGCGWAGAALYAGSTLIVVREIIPQQLLQTIVDEKVECGFLVPAVLLFLSQLPGIESADFSNLRRILYGASPITPELLTRCIELFGCEFTQVYGLTETTGAISALQHHARARGRRRRQRASAGRGRRAADRR